MNIYGCDPLDNFEKKRYNYSLFSYFRQLVARDLLYKLESKISNDVYVTDLGVINIVHIYVYIHVMM